MIRLTTCLLLIVAAAGSPWFLGGFSPWCYALAPLVTLVAALLWLCSRSSRGIGFWSWSAIGMSTLLVGYVWLQAAPLPSSLLRAITTPARLDRINTLLQTETSCDQEATAASARAWDRISSDPPETKRQWAILATALAICVIAMVLAGDELCRLAIVFLLAINGATFGVFALYQRAAAPGTIYWTIKPQWESLPFGAFVNRNHAGLFLALSALCALFGICLLLSQRILRPFPTFDDETPSTRRGAVSLTDLRMIWLSQQDGVLLSLAFCALFCALSSIVAASRSGALAFGAVIILATIMLFVSGADRRIIGVIGLLGGLAAFVAGAKFNYLVDRFDPNAIEAGWDGRYAHWTDVLEQSSEFSLTGVGHGAYAFATLPYLSKPSTAWFQHADNQYVETFVELGAAGSILIIAFAIFFAIRCVTLICFADLQSKIVGLFGCALMVICLINSLSDFALAMPGVLLPMALAAGLVLGYRTQQEIAEKSNWTVVGRSLLLKFALIGVLCWATAIGVAHFANGQARVTLQSDPAQSLARNVSKNLHEPSVTAFTKDAEQSIHEFVSPSRAVIESIAPKLFQEDSYSLEHLAMIKRAMDLENIDESFHDLRDAIQSKDQLRSARKDYLAAIKIAPMRFENHLALAKLDLFLCPGKGVSWRAEQVRRINPSSGINAGRTGMVSVINGDFEAGGAMLNQALREEPQLNTHIFDMLKAEMTVQQIANFVLIDDAPLLIRAADRFYNDKDEWFARNYLYTQLRKLIESGEVKRLSEAEKNYYLAKTKRMSGDFDGAFVDFEAACKDWSAPLEWHKELAAFYQERGKFSKAITTLQRISEQFGYDPVIDRRIQALKLKDRDGTGRRP